MRYNLNLGMWSPILTECGTIAYFELMIYVSQIDDLCPILGF